MCALLLLFSALSSSLSTTVTIRNDEPRLDVNGAIVDGHDLSLRVLPNGTYLMTTIEYGLCVAPTGEGCDSTPDHCGFRANHNITIWTSNTLLSGSWVKAGNAFPLSARPPGLIFRPDAIFNPNTQQTVLWYNFAGGGNTYVTSVSSSPFGPFADFAVSNATDATWEGGDFHLFIDDTLPENEPAQGYVIWTGMAKSPGNDHRIRISKLTPDFRHVTSDEPYTFDDFQFNEAPSIFSRNGVWYALFGHCCCFCYQGSGLFVHTAPTPMGPWTLQSSPVSDIACQAPSAVEALLRGVPTPGQGCLYGGSKDVSVTRSQQDFVAKLPDGEKGFTFLYFGSRWGQSPDGIKGHEPQYVFPLSFLKDGTLQHLTWNDSVSFPLAVAA